MNKHNNEITMNDVEKNYDASEYGVEFNALAYAYFNRYTENSIEEITSSFEEKNHDEVKKHSNLISINTEIMKEIKSEIETSHSKDVERFNELVKVIESEYDVSQLGESTELNLFEDEMLENLLETPKYTLYEIFDNHYLKKSDAEYINDTYGQISYTMNEVQVTKNELLSIDVYTIIGDMQIMIDFKGAVDIETGNKTFK